MSWQASAVVPGSSGHRCSSGHLSFHATDRAKNNVLRSLFSLVVISETVLWMQATDSIYPELRGAQLPFCFPVFHHPLTAPNFFLTPSKERVSFAVCRRIFFFECKNVKDGSPRVSPASQEANLYHKCCYVIRQEFCLTNSFYKQALLDRLSTEIQTHAAENKTAP